MASGGAQGHQAARARPAIGETIIGVGVLALAIVMAWQALSMPVSPIYAQVGPTIVPIITALALGMLGILLLVDAVQGGWQPEEEKEVTPDRAALLWIVAGLVLVGVKLLDDRLETGSALDGRVGHELQRRREA